MKKRCFVLTPGSLRAMRALTPRVFLTLAASILLAGCSPPPGSTQPPPAESGPAAVKSQETPATTEPAASPSASASNPGEPSPSPAAMAHTASPPPAPASSSSPGQPAPEAAPLRSAVPESTPVPHPEATKPGPGDFAAPPAARAPIAVDIGGLVEVGSTKPGLVRIGSSKCKLCHRLQFESWAKTAHAARTPPLDCESCHGPGSEYKTLAIMKDGAKAKAAGLVIPVRSFCSKCHTSGWSDDLLKRAHAHKAGA